MASADIGYQEFLSQLEKDPMYLPSLKASAESNQGSAEAAAANEKKVSALMLHLQKKWAGTLEVAADAPKISPRQV